MNIWKRTRETFAHFGTKRIAIVGAAAICIAVAAFHFVSQANMEARLMRADPDSIVADPALQSFATSFAARPYQQHCASCHGEKMQGDPVRGVPNLVDKDWLYGSGRVAEIEHTILFGIRSGLSRGWNLADMPAFGTAKPYRRYDVPTLEPAEIRDVAEFLVVTGGQKGDVDAAERGSRIFAEKGQCFDCHSNDAQGDSSIGAPNLVDNIWLRGRGTRKDIYDTIAQGLAGPCPAWMAQLDAVTIRALAVSINAASHASLPSLGSPHAPQNASAKHGTSG